jgi:hypothetical protein
VITALSAAKLGDALQKTDVFDDIPKNVWQQEWVVHCKPIGNGQAAMKYLSAYIFRVAITNNRILKLTNGRVIFCYKDTKTGETKLCSPSAEEFIRRFLQHILPRGFVKVRYYGLFSPSYRVKLTDLHQQLSSVPPDTFLEGLTAQDQNPSFLCNSVICHVCGQAMQRLHGIRPKGRHPP